MKPRYCALCRRALVRRYRYDTITSRYWREPLIHNYPVMACLPCEVAVVLHVTPRARLHAKKAPKSKPTRRTT